MLDSRLTDNDSRKNPGAIVIEGHIQGLSNARSLGEEGIPVYIVDKTTCIAQYSRYCRKFFLCPDFITDEFALFLIDLAIKERIKAWVLIPSNDHAVYTIAKHKAELEPYYKVITPGLDIIDNIYDKSRLLTIAEKIGIKTPLTYYFRSADDKLPENLTFPVLTKGTQGLSFFKSLGLKAFLANDEQELRYQLKLISQKMFIGQSFTQELIPHDGTNKTISFTAFCEEGDVKTYWMGVKHREHPLKFGTATFCESIYEQELLKLSRPLLNALYYTGVCEVEYLKDPRDGKFKLIEINARTWLWVGLAKTCGVDYAKMIYDFANEANMVFPKRYRLGAKWIHFLTDTFITIKAIFTKKLKLSEYLSSLKGIRCSAVFMWKDLKPSFMIIFLLIYLAKKRNFLLFSSKKNKLWNI